MRLACVAVPLFPLAARLRSEPDLKGEAVAVCEGNGNAARIVAASRRAREKGVGAGQTLPQARALLPGLLARARDHASERAAQEALLEAAEAFSPRVEDAGDGVVYVDLDGHAALRGPGDRIAAELSLARDLIAAVEKAGLPARAGIGGGKLAAGRGGGGVSGAALAGAPGAGARDRRDPRALGHPLDRRLRKAA